MLGIKSFIFITSFFDYVELILGFLPVVTEDPQSVNYSQSDKSKTKQRRNPEASTQDHQIK